MDAKNEKVSDTPRTDAATEKDPHVLTQFAYHDFVDGDFARELERENAELARDKARLDWLEGNGRIAKMSDGWNAWTFPKSDRDAIKPTAREAIDAAMQPQPARKD